MLPEKLVELFSHIGVSEDSENGLYSYNGKNLDISMYKVGGESGAGETIFLVREVTEIQKWEQKLRVKLAQKRYISRYTFSDILGTSNEIQVLKKTAQKMAQFDHPVYIYGESGTGKELFAQANPDGRWRPGRSVLRRGWKTSSWSSAECPILPS